MPTTNTSTIGTSQDYTTIAAWEAATDNDLVSGDVVEIGVLNVAGNYNESVTIAGATTDATRYRKLTVADSLWHAGTYTTTGIAYMLGNPSGRQIYVDENNFWLDRMLISHVSQSPDASDEAVRFNNGISGGLITRCILRGDGSTSDCDGVYSFTSGAASNNTTFTISNSLIYDWGRGGVMQQEFSGGDGTLTANVDHCTFHDCALDGGNDAGGPTSSSTGATGVTATLTYNIYNTVSTDGGGTGEDFEENAASGGPTFNWNGSHNCCSDTSLTSVGLTTNAQESKSSADIYTAETTDDFTPASGQALEDNGTNRQGSEADSRDDYSLDIAEAARGTTGVEIGCYAIAEGGGGQVFSSLLTESHFLERKRLYN